MQATHDAGVDVVGRYPLEGRRCGKDSQWPNVATRVWILNSGLSGHSSRLYFIPNREGSQASRVSHSRGLEGAIDVTKGC